MNSQLLGLRVASVLFGAISLAQLTRFVLQVEVVAGGHRLPFWPSAVAFVVLGGLSIWLWKLARMSSN